MPRGVTPIRVRRRRSDAKWRASVAMCYNIMKNVIPNQKKLGRRKLSKALTLKETERHIVTLERKLREIIEKRAAQAGKVVMIEKEGGYLSPATFEEIKLDFATKKYSSFSGGPNSGKKRYNVPADIEMSLEMLSQQSCSLVSVNSNEIENTYPHLYKAVDSTRDNNKVQSTIGIDSKLGHLLTQPLDSDGFDRSVTRQHKTPCKGHQQMGGTKYRRLYMSAMPNTETKRELNTKTPSKACKQLPFNTSPTPSKMRHSHRPTGFTPVKLPYGLDSKNPVLGVPGTPAISLIGSPFNCFTMLETPGSSCFPGVDSFELTDNDEGTSLLCTESIDSMDLDLHMTKLHDYETESPMAAYEEDEELVEYKPAIPSRQKTDGKGGFHSKCRRRLDKDYGLDDQEVPDSDKSCLDFDGYLLFHQQNVGCVDMGRSSSETAHSLAKMWETLAADDRAVYTRMATHNDSPVSHDLSADLVEIDLKPLNRASQPVVVGVGDDSQEVPCLSVKLCEGDTGYDIVPGYEDLGIFYTDTAAKHEYLEEDDDDDDDDCHTLIDVEDDDCCQVVPSL